MIVPLLSFFAPRPSLVVINYSDSSLRVETLSFEEAADFNPQGDSIFSMTIRLGLCVNPAEGLC